MTVREKLILPLIVSQSVLDVGSVGQTQAYNLWNFLEQHAASLTGIDTIPSDDRRVVAGNMETYRFHRHFDVVVAGDIIEHVDNQGLFLQNVHDHLRPGGRLILTTPNAKWWTVMFKPNPTHTLWHDRFTLKSCLEKSGFAVERLNFYVGNRAYSWWKRLLLRQQGILAVARRAERKADRPLAICMVTTSYPTYRGDSAGIFIAELASSLSQQGHQVKIIAPKPDHRQTTPGPVPIVDVAYTWPFHRGYIAYGQGVMENFRNWKAWWQLPAYVIAMNTAVLNHARQADIIHVHWWLNATVIYPALKVLGKPVVITAHGSDIDQMLRTPIQKLIAKKVFRLADSIITVSQSNQRRIVDLGVAPQRIHVIPNGIVGISRLLGLSSDKAFQGRCLFVGRLLPVKNPVMALRAFAAVAQAHPQASLTIVGQGPLRAAMESLVRDLNLTSKVLFRGQLNRDDLLEEYRLADCFLLSSRHEGLPLVVLEAMAAGVPILATTVGGVPDVIKDGRNGLLVSADNEIDFSAGLQRLFSDEQLRVRLRQAARQTVEHGFGWSDIAKQTWMVYNQSLIKK